MAFTVEIEVDREFDAECSFDRAFEVLADVPWSVSHFPKVEHLEDLGDGKYRWEMEKIGIQSYYIQTVYACKYVNNRDKGTVKWTPVKGVGNAQVSGQWKLFEVNDNLTRFQLVTDGALELPFPKLTKMLLGPFVAREFESLIDQYINNLIKTFESKKKAPAKKKK